MSDALFATRSVMVHVCKNNKIGSFIHSTSTTTWSSFCYLNSSFQSRSNHKLTFEMLGVQLDCPEDTPPPHRLVLAVCLCADHCFAVTMSASAVTLGFLHAPACLDQPHRQLGPEPLTAPAASARPPAGPKPVFERGVRLVCPSDPVESSQKSAAQLTGINHQLKEALK